MKRRNRNVRRHEEAKIKKALEGLREKQNQTRGIDFISSHKLILAVLICIGVLYLLLKAKVKGNLEARMREYAMLGDRQ